MKGLPIEYKGVADVAQLVEQLIRNQQVNGSSPFVGSIKFSIHSFDSYLLERVRECDLLRSHFLFLRGLIACRWSLWVSLRNED